MTLVLPDAAEVIALKAILNHTPQDEDFLLRLFKNDYTPDETTETADLTEADFSGYAEIALTGASFTVTSGEPTEAVYVEQTFLSDADQTAQTIYGYYIVRDVTEDVLWVERFATPVVIEDNGDFVEVTPRITLKDEGD